MMETKLRMDDMLSAVHTVWLVLSSIARFFGPVSSYDDLKEFIATGFDAVADIDVSADTAYELVYCWLHEGHVPIPDTAHAVLEQANGLAMQVCLHYVHHFKKGRLTAHDARYNTDVLRAWHMLSREQQEQLLGIFSNKNK